MTAASGRARAPNCAHVCADFRNSPARHYRWPAPCQLDTRNLRSFGPRSAFPIDDPCDPRGVLHFGTGRGFALGIIFDRAEVVPLAANLFCPSAALVRKQRELWRQAESCLAFAADDRRGFAGSSADVRIGHDTHRWWLSLTPARCERAGVNFHRTPTRCQKRCQPLGRTATDKLANCRTVRFLPITIDLGAVAQSVRAEDS